MSREPVVLVDLYRESSLTLGFLDLKDVSVSQFDRVCFILILLVLCVFGVRGQIKKFTWILLSYIRPFQNIPETCAAFQL